MLDLIAYLDRIYYTGPTASTIETLNGLHRAHMLSVPFENLDIGLGRRIVCEEGAFIEKIVNRRRGGFCYELNGAFGALLRTLGFQVTLLSARVPRDDGSHSPEFDHLALKVDLEEPWLADVGFGDSFVEPLRLQVDIEQPQDKRNFRIVEEGGFLHMEMAESGKGWRRQYSCTLTPRNLEDFAGMCHYHQTSPESPFTRKKVCSMATPNGRVTLADRKLIETHGGVREESVLDSEEQWRAALKRHFGVVL
ncbi:MAG: arylamine N-acetyltransferase [Acidobacteriia bacterium]|nr:arylamine N-acetyltransferase [Terriglobia bacterium]